MLLLYSPFAIIEEGLISLLMLIDAKIYGVFSKLYSLYLELAMARIFDISSFDTVIKNIYVIFGVVALFIVVFSLLQAMVNPEDVAKGTKTTKDVIKRLVLCVGLTCIVPFGFDFLYDFQFSLLKFQVIPKTMIGVSSDEMIQYEEEFVDTEGENQTVSGKMSASDYTKAGLQVYGNQMALYVLNGFFFANDLNGDDIPDEVEVNASKHFGVESGIGFGALGCLVGVVVTGALAISGVGIPAAATTALGTAAICGGGVVAGIIVNDALITATAEEFSWRLVSQYFIPYYGEFDLITPFAEAVMDGRMTYTPIVSTVAGIIMLYMLFSFCLDLGLRAAKLVFYQLMAPISFLLSILPKNKDLMTNWFKAVLSTWAEVFVRIICVCGAALLISNLNFTEINNFGLIARAIIVLGVIAFAKQAPKLFSEVTGIKSGNLKLGIREKLKEGGLFAAGSAAGALIASRGNPFAAYRAGKSGWKNGDFKSIGGEAKRRYEYKQARAAGATRTQMALNSLRGAFGLDSTADSSLRKIEQGTETVKNRTSYNIDFTDADGNVIAGRTIHSGQDGISVDQTFVEDLEAQKVKNISAMTAATDDIRALDKKIAYGGAQIKFKSNLKGEAEKKIDEAGSKVRYDFQYIDENGTRQTFNGTYGEIVEFRNRNLSAEQLAQSESLEVIRDKMVSQFIAGELASSADNKTKQDLRSGFNTLINNGGYEYSYYDVDANGNQVVRTGKIAVNVGDDGSYQVTDTRIAADGSQTITNLSDGKSEYEIVSAIDKLAKSSNGVLNDEKQRIDETIIDSYRGQNEAIDNLIKQYKEQKDAKKQSDKQRGKEAAKKYSANRK